MAGATVTISQKSGIIKTSVVKKIRSFFKDRNDVSLVFLFGSFVSREMTSLSDIDVGIIFYSIPDFYEVNAINLEEYTNDKNIKQIDFLKIDCEGCEYEVIKYLSDDFLRTKINKIVMEFHKDLNSTETLLLLSKLEKNGYINTVKGDIILSINKNKKIKK